MKKHLFITMCMVPGSGLPIGLDRPRVTLLAERPPTATPPDESIAQLVYQNEAEPRMFVGTMEEFRAHLNTMLDKLAANLAEDEKKHNNMQDRSELPAGELTLSQTLSIAYERPMLVCPPPG